MPRTIGYHLVKSAYGLWLPGEDRGSWSDAWDNQIGYHQPHMLHPSDPVRHRMAAERMKHPAVRFTADMQLTITDAIKTCIAKSNGGLIVYNMAIEETHMHLSLPYTGKDIDATAKWLADQTTKAVHRQSNHTGPVWAKGCWRSFIYDEDVWNHVGQYIDNHNKRRGVPDPLL
jgi:hypothetical protein